MSTAVLEAPERGASTPLTVCSVYAAHVAISVQQAVHVDGFTPIELCTPTGASVPVAPIVSAAAAEALLSEFEDF